MTGIVDLAALVRSVSVAPGVSIETVGVSLQGVAALFDRFPVLAQLFGGGEGVVLTPALVMEQGPEVAAAVIVAGVEDITKLSREEVAEKELIVQRYPVRAQWDLLESVFEVTLGAEGFGPFVVRLRAQLDRLGAPLKAPGTN